MTAVVWLSEIGPGQRALVGGKGLSLARLLAAGFHVPDGFVITTATTEAIDAANGAIAPDVERELLAALARLCPDAEAVAVRSSAVAEDGESASFAGQHETILDVRGQDPFLQAVRDCLASLHSPTAIAYRERAGHDHTEARMAIVVQRMVTADVSGVAFTADPLTGDTARVVVEAVQGTGHALVSGEKEADRLVLNRISLATIESHHAGEPVLHAKTAREVAKLALRAEEKFGAPQDIEFGIADGDVWMLQSRPITTTGWIPSGGGWLNEFDTPTSSDDLWTGANIQEVLPGTLTPLTMSSFTKFARKAYSDNYRRLKLLDQDEEPLFVGLFYNRAFLSVAAMRMIADRVLGADADAVEHRFLGGELHLKTQREHSLRLWKFRLRSIVPLLWTTARISKSGRRVDRETRAWERRVRADRPFEMTGEQLQARRDELATFVSGTFGVHLQATGCAGQGFEMVVRALRPILKDETEGTIPALFSGMRHVESARIALDLWELSRIALREDMAAALRAPDFDPRASGLPSSWRAAFDRFIEDHGHRGLNEMEPAVPNWREDPGPVISVVASYLEMRDGDGPRATLARQEQERLRLTAELERRMNRWRRPAFRWTLRQAQRWVALRERTKSVIVRGTRLVDYYMPACGQRLVEAGLVSEPRDIFFLTVDELADGLCGRAERDFRAKVARRKREFERNRHVELPERFRGHPVPLEPDLSHHTGEVMTGTPVSPGLVTGRARVILDPAADGPIQPGEILVAPVTDAGWTPLFALASGLVVDMGSTLSHGSTVAREYGLPAVVNVRRATRSIRNGDLIAVNGTRGTVTVLEEARERMDRA